MTSTLYLQLADDNGKLCYPLNFYSFGNVSKEVSSLLSCLASKLAEQSRLLYSQTKFYVETSVMATLMRCTARIIIDRFNTILHQHTVPYTLIDRSSEETAITDFAEDDVNDLLELGFTSNVTRPHLVPPALTLDFCQVEENLAGPRRF
jgi:hypothetical protein